MTSVPAISVPDQQAPAPDPTAFTLPEPPDVVSVTSSTFGRRWWAYLAQLAELEDRLAAAATQAEIRRAWAQQHLNERHGYHLATATTARDEYDKACFPSDATRNAAALAWCAGDDAYQQAKLDLEGALSEAARLKALSERCRRARRDAHAFIAWVAAYLAREARNA